MKLEKWALIAQIVSGVAIAVTLVVLILEVRANTDEIRAATQANVAGRTQALIIANLSNPQIGRAQSKAEAGDDLTDSERRALFLSLILDLKLAEESYITHRSGRLDDEIWRTRAALLMNSMDIDLNRQAWTNRSRNDGTFIPDFDQWLDAELMEKYGE